MNYNKAKEILNLRGNGYSEDEFNEAIKVISDCYDNALEKARIWRERNNMSDNIKCILDDIFPELAKSKDNEMIDRLLALCEGAQKLAIGSNISYNSEIDWLKGIKKKLMMKGE